MAETKFDPLDGIDANKIFTPQVIGAWCVPGGITLTKTDLASVKSAMGTAIQLGWLKKEAGSIKPFDGADSETMEGAQGVISTVTSGGATKATITFLETLREDVLKLVLRTPDSDGKTYEINPDAQAPFNGFVIKAKQGDNVMWFVMPKAQAIGEPEFGLERGTMGELEVEIVASTVSVGEKAISSLFLIETPAASSAGGA